METLFENTAGAALRLRTLDSEEVFVTNYASEPLLEGGVYLNGKFGMTSSSDGGWGMVVDGSEIRTDGLAFSTPSVGTQLLKGL